MQIALFVVLLVASIGGGLLIDGVHALWSAVRDRAGIKVIAVIVAVSIAGLALLVAALTAFGVLAWSAYASVAVSAAAIGYAFVSASKKTHAKAVA